MIFTHSLNKSPILIMMDMLIKMIFITVSLILIKHLPKFMIYFKLLIPIEMVWLMNKSGLIFMILL